MYLFIYKTTHKNGKFYIGRHQTNDLNDGYLGSGKWVQSIKNKSTLSREIIAEALEFEELCKLEEYYIDLYWENPLCMNYKRASIGWNSKDISEMNIKNSLLGIHPAKKEQNKKALSNRQKELAKNGKHNSQSDFFKRRASKRAKNMQLEKLEKGTHQTQDENFRRESSKRLKQIIKKQIKEGNHTLTNTIAVKDNLGNIYQVDRNHQKYLSGELQPITKGTVPVKDKDNNIFRVDKNDPRYVSGELIPFLKGRKQKRIICPHCNKEGGISNMVTYHLDNCKFKKNNNN